MITNNSKGTMVSSHLLPEGRRLRLGSGRILACVLTWHIDNLSIETLVVDGVLLLAKVKVGHKERGKERDAREADRANGDVTVDNSVGSNGSLTDGVKVVVSLERLDVAVDSSDGGAVDVWHFSVHLSDHLLSPDTGGDSAANAGSQGGPKGDDGNERGNIVVWVDEETIAKDLSGSTKDHEILVAMRDTVKQTNDGTDQAETHGGDAQEDGPLSSIRKLGPVGQILGCSLGATHSHVLGVSHSDHTRLLTTALHCVEGEDGRKEKNRDENGEHAETPPPIVEEAISDEAIDRHRHNEGGKADADGVGSEVVCAGCDGETHGVENENDDSAENGGGDAHVEGIGEHSQANGDTKQPKQDLALLARLIEHLVEGLDSAHANFLVAIFIGDGRVGRVVVFLLVELEHVGRWVLVGGIMGGSRSLGLSAVGLFRR
ncbi:hypothetical protein HG530_015185 [Fusarium avenaceum]|nr:hypothetical protein HG530_015185 [Fusarium avenaceum]